MMGLQEIIAANAAVVGEVNAPSRVDAVREHVAREITALVDMVAAGAVDVEANPHSRGYLQALVGLAKDVLHEDIHAAPYCDAEAILNGRQFCRLCDKGDHLARVRELAFS